MIDSTFLLPADQKGREKMTERIAEKHKNINSCRIAKSILDRPIDAFYIGGGSRYVVVAAAHHALESITSNVAYALLDYLLDIRTRNVVFGIDCKLLLSKFCFIVVPCVNPDGIEMRYHGAGDSPLHDRQMRLSGGDFSTWQANARGVDLNHNYDFGFAEYKMRERECGIVPGPTLFGGEYPESEPETKGVASLIRATAPCAVVSLHSQGGEIYSFPHTARVERIAARLSDITGYKQSRPVGTAVYTGLCDYTASLGIPSFTFEVGKGVNPLPESRVSDIFLRMRRAVTVLPTLL